MTMTDDQVKALLEGVTPGRWRSDDVAVRLEDKSLVALVYGNGRGLFSANARLIAAAPDLARALIQACAELEMLKTAGIIEVSIRNPSVADYMQHWEGRAEKAGPPVPPRSRGDGDMTDLRIKRVMRYDEIQGHFRLFRVMWEVGIVGDGQGHSNMLSVAVQPKLFLFDRISPCSWMLVILGVRIHRKRSFGGIFV
jgi:hypothetical protein